MRGRAGARTVDSISGASACNHLASNLPAREGAYARGILRHVFCLLSLVSRFIRRRGREEDERARKLGLRKEDDDDGVGLDHCESGRPSNTTCLTAAGQASRQAGGQAAAGLAISHTLPPSPYDCAVRPSSSHATQWQCRTFAKEGPCLLMKLTTDAGCQRLTRPTQHLPPYGVRGRPRVRGIVLLTGAR